MGCYYTLCHNTYGILSYFTRFVMKRENAGSWDFGWKRSKYWKPILHNSKSPETPWKSFLELIRIFGERINARGPTACPRDRGCAPQGATSYLVGPLDLHRPQFQLYIFRLTESKIREKVSSHFTTRSHRQALISLGRADLESVQGSGEGDSSPLSSSTILHHQFHDAHRREWVIPS